MLVATKIVSERPLLQRLTCLLVLFNNLFLITDLILIYQSVMSIFYGYNAFYKINFIIIIVIIIIISAKCLARFRFSKQPPKTSKFQFPQQNFTFCSVIQLPSLVLIRVGLGLHVLLIVPFINQNNIAQSLEYVGNKRFQMDRPKQSNGFVRSRKTRSTSKFSSSSVKSMASRRSRRAFAIARLAEK